MLSALIFKDVKLETDSMWGGHSHSLQ